MTETATVKTPVRYLTAGDVLAGSGETVVAVQPILGAYGRSNPRYYANRRNVCLRRADGTERWAEWNASTNLYVIPRSM